MMISQGWQLEQCSFKRPSILCGICLLSCHSICHRRRRSIPWQVIWRCLSLIHWKWRVLVPNRGLFLICCFKIFFHCIVIGWMEPWPQFFFLVLNSMRLLRGVVAPCLERVRLIVAYLSGFLIPSYSFHDGVTFHSFSHEPDSFLLYGSFCISFTLLFFQGPNYCKWLFVWRFCKQSFR